MMGYYESRLERANIILSRCQISGSVREMRRIKEMIIIFNSALLLLFHNYLYIYMISLILANV